MRPNLAYSSESLQKNDRWLIFGAPAQQRRADTGPEDRSTSGPTSSSSFTEVSKVQRFKEFSYNRGRRNDAIRRSDAPKRSHEGLLRWRHDWHSSCVRNLGRRRGLIMRNAKPGQ